jgi:hypothetical protein
MAHHTHSGEYLSFSTFIAKISMFSLLFWRFLQLHFLCLCHSEASKDGLAHGAVLGVPKTGIIGYNCNYSKLVDDGAVYDHLNYIKDARGRSVYSGDKWQCVEYARRWYVQSQPYIFHRPVIFLLQSAILWNLNPNFMRK